MAKPKTRAQKPKPERKKKASGTSKPTAEQLSDQQRQALLFAHKRKIVPLLEAEKNAKTAVTQAFELAKKEGIPKKDIKLAIQLETEEGIEAAKNDLERTNRIARWLGVGKQLEMFGDKETVRQRHYEDGRRAALNDQPASPPGHLAQHDAQVWLEGHSAGRNTLNETRVRDGFRSLGDAAAGLADQAAAAAGLGTEPATHAEMH